MNLPTDHSTDTSRRSGTLVPDPTTRPGWPEIAAAAAAVGILYLLTRQILHRIPDDHAVAEGLTTYALSALIGLGAFAAAFAVRIRALAAFGVRRVSWRWILAGAGFGVVAFVLSVFSPPVYRALGGTTHHVQTTYQAAATGGPLVLVATLLLGAVATPIGEEFAYRGVLTNALGRYGPWVAVLGSAVVFALAHGINEVLPVAFINGVICALLFRKTRSVWPGVFVHLVNNSLVTLSSVVIPLLVKALT